MHGFEKICTPQRILPGSWRILTFFAVFVVICAAPSRMSYADEAASLSENPFPGVSVPKKIPHTERAAESDLPAKSIDQWATHPSNEPAYRQAVFDFIESWRKAWERSAGRNGDMDAYINHYSDAYFTERIFYANLSSLQVFDRESWSRIKTARNRAKKWISVQLDNIDVICSTSSKYAVVHFRQVYESSNYSDTAMKTIILYKEKGGWKIISESSL